MPVQTNIALLLSRLSEESLARRLVAPFAEKPPLEAVKAAQEVLTAVQTAHQAEPDDDTVEEA